MDISRNAGAEYIASRATIFLYDDPVIPHPTAVDRHIVMVHLKMMYFDALLFKLSRSSLLNIATPLRTLYFDSNDNNPHDGIESSPETKKRNNLFLLFSHKK